MSCEPPSKFRRLAPDARLSLLDLPVDSLDVIFSFLQYTTITTSLRQTCRVLHDLICSPRLHSATHVILDRRTTLPRLPRLQRSRIFSGNAPSSSRRRCCHLPFLSSQILMRYGQLSLNHLLIGSSSLRSLTISNLETDNGEALIEGGANAVFGSSIGQKFGFSGAIAEFFSGTTSFPFLGCIRFFAVRFDTPRDVIVSVRNLGGNLREFVMRDCWINNMDEISRCAELMKFPNLERLELALRRAKRDEMGIARICDKITHLGHLLKLFCSDSGPPIRLILRGGHLTEDVVEERTPRITLKRRVRSFVLISPVLSGGLVLADEMFVDVADFELREVDRDFWGEFDSPLSSSLLVGQLACLQSLSLCFLSTETKRQWVELRGLDGADDRMMEDSDPLCDCLLFSSDGQFSSRQHVALHNLTLFLPTGGDAFLSAAAWKCPNLRVASLRMGRITVAGIVQFVFVLRRTLLRLSVVQDDWSTASSRLCVPGLFRELRDHSPLTLSHLFISGRLMSQERHLFQLLEPTLSFKVSIYEGELWHEFGACWVCPTGCGVAIRNAKASRQEIHRHLTDECRNRVPDICPPSGDNFWGLSIEEEQEPFVWNCPLPGCGFAFRPEKRELANAVAIGHLQACSQNLVLCPCCSEMNRIQISKLEDHMNSGSCEARLWEVLPRWEHDTSTCFLRKSRQKMHFVPLMTACPEDQFDVWKQFKVPGHSFGRRQGRWRTRGLCFLNRRPLEEGPRLLSDPDSGT